MGWIDNLIKGNEPVRPDISGAEHLRHGEHFLRAAASPNTSDTRMLALATLGNAHINAARLAFEIQKSNDNEQAIRPEWVGLLHRDKTPYT